MQNFSTLQLVYNSSFLTRQRLRKGLGAIIVGVLSLFVMCAVPTRASASDDWVLRYVTINHGNVITIDPMSAVGGIVGISTGLTNDPWTDCPSNPNFTSWSDGVTTVSPCSVGTYFNINFWTSSYPRGNAIGYSRLFQLSNSVTYSEKPSNSYPGAVYYISISSSGVLNPSAYGTNYSLYNDVKYSTQNGIPSYSDGDIATGSCSDGTVSGILDLESLHCNGDGFYHLDVVQVSPFVNNRFFFIRSGGVWSVNSSMGGLNIDAPNTITRFISTSPLNEEVVSSTTPVTIGSHLYINSDDYKDGMYLNVAFTNQTIAMQGGSALDAWNSAWGVGSTGGFASIKIPLVSGDNVVSTTTSNFVRDGRVTASWFVQNPTFWSSLWWIGSLFSGNTSIATSTTFIVGEKTQTDLGWDNSGAGLANGILFGTTTAGIATSTFEACYPSAFNLVGCAKGLIIPSPQSISLALGQAKDGFLSYFPFGYVSRFYKIISGTATTTLPNLSITVPAGFPASGDTLNLTMWGKLMGPGSYLSTATSTVTGHTFYGTFESYWEKFVYFVFGLGVALRLLGMNSVVSFGLGSKDKNPQKIQYKKK